jgi:SAM-dependent methyltransferase
VPVRRLRRLVSRALVRAGTAIAHQATERPHTIASNRELWSGYDWSQQGDEWSNDPEWKASLVCHLLLPHVPAGSRVLEIGPGAGRWTQYLAMRASYVAGVDVTPECVRLCRLRFAGLAQLDFFVNDGRDLAFLASESFDRVWSWDVFVHIAAADAAAYVPQLARVLRPGGRGLVHHARRGPDRRGWRSDVSAEQMSRWCEEAGLRVIAQDDAWDDGRCRIWPGLPASAGPDVFTVFER